MQWSGAFAMPLPRESEDSRKPLSCSGQDTGRISRWTCYIRPGVERLVNCGW